MKLTSLTLAPISVSLKFTPLEFETVDKKKQSRENVKLKFTPLEFETVDKKKQIRENVKLKFTPLEFETTFYKNRRIRIITVKIYSVGV